MSWLLRIGTALAISAGCAKSEPPQTLPPAPVVDKQTLAAAGYYSWDEAKAAWAERENAGVVSRDGSELVGTKPAGWYLTDWVGGEAKSLADLRGRVVVVRFWTSPDCPFCAKTLPALQTLADEFADQPVTIIGAYHAKPIGAVTDMAEPAKLAVEWKVKFPIALDREWQTLRSWWLASAPRNATSVTFVIGKDGAIRYVHPGPVFHPSSKPGEAKQNSDFERVREEIREAAAAS